MKVILASLGIVLTAVWLYFLALTNQEIPKRVDAGGHGLCMRLTGQGSPTVVLDLDLSEKLKSELAGFSRVVFYDRAFWRCSDEGPRPRDAAHIALELRTALANAKVPPPYVLVSEGLGGLFVRVFAAKYANDVAGLILVDPEVEEPVQGAARRWLSEHTPDNLKAIDNALNMVTRREVRDWKQYQWEQDVLEKKHLLSACPQEFLSSWPRFAAEEIRLELDSGTIYEETIAITGALLAELEPIQASFDQARSAALPSVPVTLLTAMGSGNATDSPEQAWTHAKREARKNRHAGWLQGIPGSRHVLAEKTEASIPEEQPELFTDAIRQMVDQVRLGKRLP